jgi:DNA-binding Lrp family transcriptional regulator
MKPSANNSGLDELDMRLIEMLQRDSLAPFVDIASALGVTEGTVRNRVRRLRRMGIIRKFTVAVDSATLPDKRGVCALERNAGAAQRGRKKAGGA